jgi:AcrR family transcriptional regulator
MDDDVRSRILDSTVHLASVHGLTRLSLSDVAKHVGLSRPTVYRHFPTRDELIAAAVGREASMLVDAVITSITGISSPRAAVEAAVLEALRLTREHALLDRIIRTEPETLVPLLVAGWNPGHVSVLGRVRQSTEALLAFGLPRMDEVARRRVADVLARLLISYAINPPDDPPEIVASSVAAMVMSNHDNPDAGRSTSSARPSTTDSHRGTR